MPLLGAHMSIAGGFHRAVEAAAALGMQTVQLFTYSPSQWAVKPAGPARKTGHRTEQTAADGRGAWRSPPIPDAAAAAFREALARTDVLHPLSHSSYLINVASPDPALRAKSVAALTGELERAERLGVPWVVLHPGAHVGAGDTAGLAAAADSLREALAAAPPAAGILLENTAGQGSCLGWRLAHLGELLRALDGDPRLGVCLDTCHAFAAGYELRDKPSWRAFVKEVEQELGLERVRAFHLNDSQGDLGSRKDRHAHIGHGKLGEEPFRLLLRDRRFRRVPMYLETAKGKQDGEEWDAVNLRTLRRLAEAD